MSLTTVGALRRLSSASIDFALACVPWGVLAATGAIDMRVVQPPPDWFWSEHALSVWLDAPQHVLTPPLMLVLVYWLWIAVSEAIWCRTPGDRVTGIRVVDADGDPPSPLRRLARALLHLLTPATLGLAYAWVVVSPTRRGWHDILSGTYVAAE